MEIHVNGCKKTKTTRVRHAACRCNRLLTKKKVHSFPMAERCGCARSRCKNGHCPCCRAGNPCTDVCTCSNCENPTIDELAVSFANIEASSEELLEDSPTHTWCLEKTTLTVEDHTENPPYKRTIIVTFVIKNVTSASVFIVFLYFPPHAVSDFARG